MKLSREEVLHISTLCRMSMSDAELKIFQEQISNILENFEILKEVDTTDVPPTAYPIHMENIIREDKTAPCLPQSDILANAPHQEEGYFRVKAVLD